MTCPITCFFTSNGGILDLIMPRSRAVCKAPPRCFLPILLQSLTISKPNRDQLGQTAQTLVLAASTFLSRSVSSGLAFNVRCSAFDVRAFPLALSVITPDPLPDPGAAWNLAEPLSKSSVSSPHPDPLLPLPTSRT